MGTCFKTQDKFTEVGESVTASFAIALVLVYLQGTKHCTFANSVLKSVGISKKTRKHLTFFVKVECKLCHNRQTVEISRQNDINQLYYSTSVVTRAIL